MRQLAALSRGRAMRRELGARGTAMLASPRAVRLHRRVAAASLCVAYLGTAAARTIDELRTPSLVCDRAVVEQNAATTLFPLSP